jgi:hypothetical protein
MNIAIHETASIPMPLEKTWERFADIGAMTSFVGYGPIPGIQSARWLEGSGAVGSVREIVNTDGSKHKEEVMVFDLHERIEDRIFDMTSPFRLMVREARDIFEFSAEGDGTRLERTFRFELTSPLWWPAARTIGAFFRRAMRRHHANLAR